MHPARAAYRRGVRPPLGRYWTRGSLVIWLDQSVSPRAHGQVGAAGHQEGHHVRMALARGPHHRGLIAKVLAPIDVGAFLNEQSGNRNIAGPRRQHQRVLSVLVRDVGVRSSFKEHLDDLCISHSDRLGQRARAVAVDHTGARTFLQQRFDKFAIDPVRGPVQRCRSVCLGLVHIGAFGDQREGCAAIAGLNPIRENGPAFARASAGRLGVRGGGQRKQHGECAEESPRPHLGPACCGAPTTLSRRRRETAADPSTSGPDRPRRRL